MKICLAICLWGMILQGSAQTQIAFISDAHIQDVDGHAERVRSMEAQVQSTLSLIHISEPTRPY